MNDDRELLMRYTDGDPDSFAMLVQRYLNLVYFFGAAAARRRRAPGGRYLSDGIR